MYGCATCEFEHGQRWDPGSDITSEPTNSLRCVLVFQSPYDSQASLHVAMRVVDFACYAQDGNFSGNTPLTKLCLGHMVFIPLRHEASSTACGVNTHGLALGMVNGIPMLQSGIPMQNHLLSYVHGYEICLAGTVGAWNATAMPFRVPHSGEPSTRCFTTGSMNCRLSKRISVACLWNGVERERCCKHVLN